MAELIRGSLVVALSGSAGGWGYNALPSTTESQNYGWGVSVDLDDTGTIMVVGDTGDDQVQTYDLTGGVWVERASSPLDTGFFQDFGSGVALSGDGSVLAVGDPSYDSGATNRGRVRIYDYNSGTGAWDHRVDVLGPAASDFYGWSVDLNTTGTKLFLGCRNNTGAQIRVYDWTDPTWTQDASATLGAPTGTVLTYAYWWGRNLRVTRDGTSMVASYGGPTTGDSGTAVGVWDLTGSSWSRRGGELASPLGDNDEEQAVGLSISDDGNRIWVFWYGTNYTWEGRIEVYDWVDPNWVSNATENAKFSPQNPLDANVDLDDTIGFWVAPDESLVAASMFSGGTDVFFWGDVPGDTTPCITKTVDTSTVVVVDTYCVEAIPPPSNWEPDPINVPRPPQDEGAQNDQINGYCEDRGFYKIYTELAPAVNANQEYEDWLAENLWGIDFDDGVCN